MIIPKVNYHYNFQSIPLTGYGQDLPFDYANGPSFRSRCLHDTSPSLLFTSASQLQGSFLIAAVA